MPNVSLPSTVSPLELAWVAVTLLGTALAYSNLTDALSDLYALRVAGQNGTLLVTALGEVSDQRLIFLCLLCKMLMGLLAMVSPNATDAYGSPTIASIGVPVLMIVVALMLVALSYSKKSRRKVLIRMLMSDQATQVTHFPGMQGEHP